MKDYKRLTERDEFGNADIIGLSTEKLYSELCFSETHLLTKALNKLAELEDKIESGEIDYVAYKDKEIARLTAENAALQKRLENAVELPCIEPMTTWDWDDTTGLGKSNFGKYWKVLYRDEDGEFMAYMGATKAEAEAMLEKLKGGKQWKRA